MSSNIRLGSGVEALQPYAAILQAVPLLFNSRPLEPPILHMWIVHNAIVQL
jgi:hypothetical protein